MVFDLECKTGFKPRLVLSLVGFGIVSLVMFAYTVGTSYYSVSGHGDWSIIGHEMVLWLCLLGIMTIVVSIVGLFFPFTRCSSMAALIGSIMMVVVGLVSLHLADNIRRQGFERLSMEAAPLVDAIHAYDQTFGHPPNSLGELKGQLPEGYLAKEELLPEFKYLVGETAIERFHGNPWVLVLETPTGPLKWDKFLYYPEQNYPSLAHGGWIEKVGAWAYLHE